MTLPMEQLGAQFLLEQLHLPAERWLRDAQHRRRLGDVPEIGDVHEISNLPEVHYTPDPAPIIGCPAAVPG